MSSWLKVTHFILYRGKWVYLFLAGCALSLKNFVSTRTHCLASNFASWWKKNGNKVKKFFFCSLRMEIQVAQALENFFFTKEIRYHKKREWTFTHRVDYLLSFFLLLRPNSPFCRLNWEKGGKGKRWIR